MRFLLINPPCPLSEGPTPPLGLAFVAATLEQAGVEVKILDLVTYPYDKDTLSSLLASFRPQMVGSTAVTMTFDEAIRIIADVKAIDPDILTVMGGPHVSFCAQDTLASFPELDFIVLGEGEETVVELAREADDGGDWGKVSGIAYRSGGAVTFTDKRAPLDVNSLPLPARHLLPLGRYRALNMAISITTSRGCPFPCIFCVGRKMVGAKVRYRNPQVVVDELQYLGTLGFPQINVADDLFTAKKSHCLAICDEIMGRGLQLKWSCFARVGTVSPILLRRIKEAGCYAVGFGVESANAQILKTIRKGISTPQVVAAIEMCVDAGINPHVSFILGLPGETPATLNETIEFSKKLEAIGASCGAHMLAPFPGTAVRDENEKYDLRILSNNWSEYHANYAIVETSSVDRAMLNAIVDDWNADLEQRLARAKQRIQAGEPRDEKDPDVENLERILFYHDLMMSRAIEENGSWRNGGGPVSPREALRTLAGRVDDHTDRDPEESYRILNYAVEKGHLSCVQDGDYVRWAWNDYL